MPSAAINHYLPPYICCYLMAIICHHAICRHLPPSNGNHLPPSAAINRHLLPSAAI
jgi:hypothetical protein